MITLKLFLCLAPLFASSGSQQSDPRGQVQAVSMQAVSIEQGVGLSRVGNDAALDSVNEKDRRSTLDVSHGSPLSASDLSIAVTATSQTRDGRNADGERGDKDNGENGRSQAQPDRRDSEGPAKQDREGGGPGFGGRAFGPRGGFGGPPSGFGGFGFGGPPAGFGGLVFGGPPAGFGGGGKARSFGSVEVSSDGASIDSNRNGKLEEDEIDKIPPFVREMLKSRGIKLEPGMATAGLSFSFRSNLQGNVEEHRTEVHNRSGDSTGPGGPPRPMDSREPMAPPVMPNMGEPKGARGMDVSSIIFELLDMNHDGVLTREEFQRLADAMQKPQQSRSPIPRIMAPPHLRENQPGHGPFGRDMRSPGNRDARRGDGARSLDMNRPDNGPRPDRSGPDREGPDSRRPEPRRPSRTGRPDAESRSPDTRPEKRDHRRDDGDRGFDDRDSEDDASDFDRNEDRSDSTPLKSDAAVVVQPGLSGDWI